MNGQRPQADRLYHQESHLPIASKISLSGRLAIALSFGVFMLWAIYFVYRSSSVGIDGKRYFSLFDDAMISMRYAWNLTHGNGLVYNVGERVEGYTNPLMTLLMAVATLLFEKESAVLAVQIANLFFIVVCGYLTFRLSTVMQLEPSVGWIAASLLFLYYPFVYWGLMGMETGLLSTLLLLSVLVAFEADMNQTKRAGLLSITLGAAYLTRPDAILAAFCILGFLVIEQARQHGERKWYHIVVALCIFILIVVSHTAFRFYYYGQLVPNTYVLKMTGMPLLARIRDGVSFVLPFLRETWIWFSLFLTTIFFAFSRRKLLLVALFGLQLVYQIWVGGDAWDYWRMIVPYAPFAFIVLSAEVYRLVESASISRSYMDFLNRGRSRSIISPNVLLTLAFSAGIVVRSVDRFLPQMLCIESPYQSSNNAHNINRAIAIKNVVTDEGTVGLFWAGTTAYYLSNYCIDFLGKTDPSIASLPPDMSGARGWNRMISVPGHNKYDLDYSIKLLKPTYVEGFECGKQNLADWAKSTYGLFEYKGIKLHLLLGSPFVRWSVVNPVAEEVRP